MAGHPRGLKPELVDGELVTMSPASGCPASIQSRPVRLIGHQAIGFNSPVDAF
jgi:hypothetical protein